MLAAILNFSNHQPTIHTVEPPCRIFRNGNGWSFYQCPGELYGDEAVYDTINEAIQALALFNVMVAAEIA